MSDSPIKPATDIPFTTYLRQFANDDKIASDLVTDMDADTALVGRDLSADELYDHVAAHDPHPNALTVIERAAREGGYPFTRDS